MVVAAEVQMLRYMYIRETKISRHNVTGESACVDIEMEMMLFITLNHLQSRNSIMLPRVCYTVL